MVKQSTLTSGLKSPSHENGYCHGKYRRGETSCETNEEYGEEITTTILEGQGSY